MPEQSGFDPEEVAIGDTLKASDSDHAVAFGVTDVDPEDERVKVYSPTMKNTVHRWVDMDDFSVHVPNEALTSAADREQWLNDTLPQGYRFRDGERQKLEYVLADDGAVTQRAVSE
jgi:hypothetical protein